MIWTSSTCDGAGGVPGVYIHTGRKYGDGPTGVCSTDLTSKLSVRCCADPETLVSTATTSVVEDPVPVVSAKLCGEIGWPFKYGNVDVCGAAVVDGECHNDLTYVCPHPLHQEASCFGKS